MRAKSYDAGDRERRDRIAVGQGAQLGVCGQVADDRDDGFAGH